MRLNIVLILLTLTACSHSIEIEKTEEYKCGEQIVHAQYLDDDSVILNINGTNTVLSRSASAVGKRFDNSDSQMTFTKQGSNIYLSVKGKSYPLCLRLEK